MRLMMSSLLAAALVALLAAGGARLGTRSGVPRRGDVAEVVVTAERPAGLIPEVVVRANLMTEVVAHSSRPTAELSARPWALSVN